MEIIINGKDFEDLNEKELENFIINLEERLPKFISDNDDDNDNDDEEEDDNDKIRDCYEITRIISSMIFDKPCSFKKGDWITPKEDSGLKHAGEPCLVIDAFNTTYQSDKIGYPLIPIDMLIACSTNEIDDIQVYSAYSGMYEKYNGIIYDPNEE